VSAYTTAFSELYAAQTAATGATTVCAIGAITGVACVVSDVGTDLGFYGGGIGNSATMTLQTLLSAWSTLPAKNDSITVSGLPGASVTRSVLSITDRAGILYIAIGDNSIQ